MCDCRHRRVARLPLPTPPRLPWPRTSVLDCQGRGVLVFCLRSLWPRTSVFDCHSDELSQAILCLQGVHALLHGDLFVHDVHAISSWQLCPPSRPDAPHWESLFRSLSSVSLQTGASHLELFCSSLHWVVRRAWSRSSAAWRSGAVFNHEMPNLIVPSYDPFTIGATWVSWRLCFISSANAAVSAAYQLPRWATRMLPPR